MICEYCNTPRMMLHNRTRAQTIIDNPSARGYPAVSICSGCARMRHALLCVLTGGYNLCGDILNAPMCELSSLELLWFASQYDGQRSA
jgi:hypothetical protein